MLFAILAAWFGYKKGRDTGRNPFLWAFIAAGAFIGTQLLCALGIGVFLALGVELWGWSETLYDTYSPIITIVSVVASFIALLAVFRYLDKIPQQKIFDAPPPPPEFKHPD
ncbi:MAG: hypothetical protein M3Q99_05965 [Acidobacteriota bacterium]|nr:hypothetical protein [Acidobacteriota bacterium]